MKKTKMILDKKPDRLDSYRLHFIQNTELTEGEKEYLERMLDAHANLLEMNSISETATIISKKNHISLSHSYRVVRDSVDLFGDIANTKKQGLRYIMYENFMRAAKKAELQDDLPSMLRALENAAKCYNIFSEDEKLENEKYKPRTVIFTSNINALIQNEQQ